MSRLTVTEMRILSAFLLVFIVTGSHAAERPPVFGSQRPDWEIRFADANDRVFSVMPGESAKTFFDPLLQREVMWEQDVFCPTFTVMDGRLYCVYRSQGEDKQWRMGFAWSDDGLHFTRGHEPIFHAGPDDEFLGPLRDRNDISISYGDSRLFADESGTFYLFFNFFRARIEKNQQLAVATSTDLKNWKVHGRAFAKQAPLDVEVIPEMSPKRFPHPAVVTQLVGDRFVVKKLDGRYWMYLNVHSTDGSSSFCMATSENMLDWKVVRDAEGRLVHPMSSRSDQFDSGYMDTTAAVRRGDGILLIYNGINAEPGQGGDPRLQRGAHYPAQALFDKDVPFRLLKRSETPFKGGDEELERQPIVFWYAPLYESWSLVPWKGELLLYWNHAFGRRSVGLWKAPLPDNL